MGFMGKKKDKVFTLDYFRKAGARGGAIGGKKAAANMTAEERTARAQKMVAGRKWHPVLTEEEKAKRQAERDKLKKPVGRPRKAVAENPVPKRPRGRPRKAAAA